MHEKIQCSVQILTLNSAKTLERCLESVKDFAEIVILDGNSTDATLAIAGKYTDKIYPQSDAQEKNIRITDFGAIRNRGLQYATKDWVLILDSDEYLSKEAAAEMADIVKNGDTNTHFIYNLPRQYVLNHVVLDQLKPTYQVRFFYVPATQGFKKRVHERIQPKDGYRLGTLHSPEYVPLEEIHILREKWNHYLDIEQDKMKDIHFSLFITKTKANVIKFIKYVIKMCIHIITNPRNRIPVRYEWYNAWYHIQIIHRLGINLIRNTFNRKSS